MSTAMSQRFTAFFTEELLTEEIEVLDDTTISYSFEWSWKHVSWPWWQILQLIFAMVGVIGNLLVILVLFRWRRRRCSTDTLIAGLAVADLMTSIFVIPHDEIDTLPNTPLGQLYCRVVHSSVLMWTSICASIFTLTTIAIERLMAIRYPFTYQRLFTAHRSTIALGFIWVLAFVVNTYSLYITYIKEGACIVQFPSPTFQKVVGVALFLIEYVVPVIVMVFAHILTIRSLRVRTQNLTSGTEQQKHALKLLTARRRVIRLLLIVIVTFVICWTPDQLGFLAFNVGLVHYTHLYSPLYRVFVVLAFANSCVNPIIYASRNPNFRRAVKDLCGGVSSIGLQSVFGGIDDSRMADPTDITELPSIDKPRE
ncbi:galanin receptor type 2-like [Diadema setosum]|uniref:galanin receptor type 2-like n=1 Tax=Diadema setosum TaxID=31175 RepID=UPI003B3B880A